MQRLQINQLVAAFVDGVSTLARDAVLASFGADGQRRADSASRARKPRTVERVQIETDRSTAGLARLAERFRSYVAANPGLRIEEIGPAIGATSRDLTYPIRKLVEQGVVVKEGRVRATRYFVRGRRIRSKGRAR